MLQEIDADKMHKKQVTTTKQTVKLAHANTNKIKNSVHLTKGETKKPKTNKN